MRYNPRSNVSTEQLRFARKPSYARHSRFDDLERKNTNFRRGAMLKRMSRKAGYR